MNPRLVPHSLCRVVAAILILHMWGERATPWSIRFIWSETADPGCIHQATTASSP